MLCTGGLDIEGKYRNDAFVVDAKRISWFSLAGIMKGAPPKPRAYHRCAATSPLHDAPRAECMQRSARAHACAFMHAQ